MRALALALARFARSVFQHQLIAGQQLAAGRRDIGAGAPAFVSIALVPQRTVCSRARRRASSALAAPIDLRAVAAASARLAGA